MRPTDPRLGQPPHTRLTPHEHSPAGPLRLWFGLLLATLVWDASGADLHVMGWLADTQGFAWRDHWWLKNLLHDTVKQLAVLIYILVWVMVVRPVGFFKTLRGSQRLEVALGITLSLLLVSTLKRISLTSCPWELQAFGGVARYVSHWSWGVADGGGGMCFPGGHVSSAFAFLAVALPLLSSAQADMRRLGQRMTALIVVTGLVLGLVQTLRGAHYPSHTAWTALLCAAAAWANHRWFATGPAWPWAKRGAVQQPSNAAPVPHSTAATAADASGGHVPGPRQP